MYVYVNRENIVVDILTYVRYVKLQSSGFVIGCEEDKATGVIGSDCNTCYTLQKSDTSNNVNAVRVLQFEEIPSEVTVNNYKFDTETNSLVYRFTLTEAQARKQEENKMRFAAYLASHPLTWVDGKEYGVSEKDQSEISLNLNQYQIAVQAGVNSPILEWHARHEECKPWQPKDLAALSLAISQEVYPIYHLMQQYKTAIYNATSIEELDNIKLVYGAEEAEEVDAETSYDEPQENDTPAEETEIEND